MLARLARFSFRHRWLMVGIWVALLVVLNGVASSLGANFRTDFALPDSESKEVQDVLQAVNPEQAGFRAQVVFKAEQGVNDPAVQSSMEQLFVQIDEIEGISVQSPYSPEGSSQITADGRIAFAELAVTDREQSEILTLAEDIRAITIPDLPDGVTVEYGGDVFAEFEFPESELLGILAAVIILLLAFGSVLAMGLPIGTAVIGLGVGIALVTIGSNGFSMPDFAPQMTAMIGLGVGIDYALFIVTRYRENLHAGMEPERATVAALDTSGRAVMFAGITVMISLLGLFVVGLKFVQGLALAGAAGVLVMMLASITLIPALLGFVKHRIDNTSRAAAASVIVFVLLALVGVFTGVAVGAAILVGLVASIILMATSFLPFAKGLRVALPHRHDKPREEQFWYRWSRFIQHRPWIAFISAVSILVILTLPLFAIRLGFGDTGNLPETQTARRAYDMLSEGFGPGVSGPLVLVTTDPAADQAALESITATLNSTPGIQFASPPVPMGEGITLWTAYPTSAPQDEATTTLVRELRDTVLPATGIDVNVGGFTAGSIDFSDYLAKRLIYLIGAVLVLSFLLLMAVFRSVLVPLKAVVMNLLSVGAAYGVTVAIFQWGWGKELFGIGKAGPVEAWAPMMLFAIVFGLSMDYEVFLLSRMKEEFDRTGDNATAVADGLAATARVITAAAAIMVCVFAAFVLGEDRSLKLFGLGLATAVLVDATIVRMVLVPSTMELLGDRNWWLPRWLDRIIPKINVEGHADLDSEAAELLDAELSETQR
jgi:putative drug exporter of the RND superfamily